MEIQVTFAVIACLVMGLMAKRAIDMFSAILWVALTTVLGVADYVYISMDKNFYWWLPEFFGVTHEYITSYVLMSWGFLALCCAAVVKRKMGNSFLPFMLIAVTFISASIGFALFRGGFLYDNYYLWYYPLITWLVLSVGGFRADRIYRYLWSPFGVGAKADS